MRMCQRFPRFLALSARSRTWMSVRWGRALGIALSLVVVQASGAWGQSTFIRGDSNGDGTIDVGDVIGNLSVQFDGATVACESALDVDDSGDVTIGDAIVLLSFLFSAGTPPAPPFPSCGLDPSLDSLSCAGPFASCAPSLVIESPTNGAQLGTSSVVVSGDVGSFASLAGFTVEVSGVTAVVDVATQTFLSGEVDLNPGANALEILLLVNGSVVVSDAVNVTYTPIRANNLALENGVIYAARGSAGLAAISTLTREFSAIPNTPGTGSVDDVSVADGLLFVLDASGSGALSVFSLDDPLEPIRISGPVPVPVGPFAGVSASGGRVTVSGGTGLMTVRGYDADGLLAGVSSIDLGVGQPDVLQSSDGERAFVSTDFSGFVGGSSFGISVVGLSSPPAPLQPLLQIGLSGAGFSAGAASPANFPIESALLPGELIGVAHGGGLSVVNPTTGGVLATQALPFSAVNVDTLGSTAFVVGTGGRLSEVNLITPGSPSIVSTEALPGAGTLLSVAVDDLVTVVAADGSGEIIVLPR